MELACLDLEGVLVPEIWIAFAEKTGIEELRATTRDIPDYNVLMQQRLAILDQHGLKMDDIQEVIATLEPLPNRSAYELLRDSFPGGSITGAPKRRAMEIIAELEPHAREVYCGSLVYVSADGRMDSNIAIRTLLCTEGEVRCWGGGGIVADSQWRQEYQETFDKVGKFLSILEAM